MGWDRPPRPAPLEALGYTRGRRPPAPRVWSASSVTTLALPIRSPLARGGCPLDNSLSPADERKSRALLRPQILKLGGSWAGRHAACTLRSG